MKFIERSCCPICFSENIKSYRKKSFDPRKILPENFKITDSNYGSIWNLFRCQDCTFVFSNPTIQEKDLVEFYKNLEDREYSLESTGRSKNFQKILKRLDKIEKPGNRLLDIGAASGIFLHLANNLNYQISGIEPCLYLVKEAKKKYNLNLFQGTIENFKKNRKYSVITLLDIIEHLAEPFTFMKQVVKLIEKSGILVIVTPDINSLVAKITGRHWWHYRIAHLNFFNKKSITTLLNNHGFTIMKKKRYAWNFTIFYVLTRIFPNIKKKKSLQKILKKVHLKLQLFDSWEIYARKD